MEHWVLWRFNFSRSSMSSSDPYGISCLGTRVPGCVLTVAVALGCVVRVTCHVSCVAICQTALGRLAVVSCRPRAGATCA